LSPPSAAEQGRFLSYPRAAVNDHPTVRVFVAGGTGVIGRRLLPMLASGGHEVVAMSRSPDRHAWAAEHGARLVTADAFDRDRVKAVVAQARPEALLHLLTSLPPALDPRHMDEQLADNDRLRHEGTRNLVDAAVAAGTRRLVAQSDAFAYAPGGSPIKGEDDPLYLDAPYPWRRSVEAVEALEATVLGAPLETVVLRYGYFYGPGTPYAPGGALYELVRRRRFPVVGPGGGVFSFVHVDDAATATVLALERGGGVLNVVDDDPAAVRTWLPVYADAIGAEPPHRVPALAARALGGQHAVFLATEQAGASNALAKRELAWRLRYPSWRDGFRSGDSE
jgi:nucleoside-diphosphate-sugar epimerase